MKIKTIGDRFDDKGNKIFIHGSSIFILNDTYYWYGENKEYTDGINGIWTYGIKYYSSKDLLTWKDEGYMIKASNDVNNPLYIKNYNDRPHIIYNEKNNEYILFLKTMWEDKSQTLSIFKSKNLGGPYEIVKTRFRPLDMDSGDFDLKVDPVTKKAYYFFERVHKSMIVVELNDDYYDLKKETYKEFFIEDRGAPFVKEAPVYFKRGDKHYLISSLTTGYFPNPSFIAVGDTISGEYINIGRLARGDISNTTFHLQASSVFKIINKDEYILILDRWLPNLMDVKYEDVVEAFLLFKNGKIDDALKVCRDLKYAMFAPTKDSMTAFIKIKFDNDIPYIEMEEELEYDL